MAFKFRYDQLLEFREKLLEREQYELAKMTQEAKNIERECARLRMEKFKCAEAFSARQVEGISPDECRLFSENLEALEQRLLEEQTRLERVLEQLEEQRKKLVEMKKKVEMLKVLKEKEEEKYRKEESKLSQKIADELTLITWGRNLDEV